MTNPDTLEIDDGQIIIAVRIKGKTYALGTEDPSKFDALVESAKRTLEKLDEK